MKNEENNKDFSKKIYIFKKLEDKDLENLVKKYHTALAQGNTQNENMIYDSLTKNDYNPKYIYLFQGIKLVINKELEKAVTKFNLALRKDPNFTAAIIFKGEILTKLNENELALECFNKLIDLNPYNHFSWYNKGKLVNVDLKKTCHEVQDLLYIIDDSKNALMDKESKISEMIENYPFDHPAKYIGYEFLYNNNSNSIENFKNYGLVLELKNPAKAKELYNLPTSQYELKIYCERQIKSLEGNNKTKYL